MSRESVSTPRPTACMGARLDLDLSQAASTAPPSAKAVAEGAAGIDRHPLESSLLGLDDPGEDKTDSR